MAKNIYNKCINKFVFLAGGKSVRIGISARLSHLSFCRNVFFPHRANSFSGLVKPF
jgi:hypothetical protein